MKLSNALVRKTGVSGKVKETRGRWENEDRETQKGSHSFKQNCPKSTRAEREQACTAEPGRGSGLETPGTIESRGTDGANNGDGISTLQSLPGLAS